MSHQTLSELDRLMNKIRDEIDIYSVINPVNTSEKKQRFLQGLESGEFEEPEFLYEQAEDFDEQLSQLEELERELEEVEVDETVQRLYRDTVDESREMMRIAENVGNAGIVQDASRQVYGEPSQGTLNWANGILSQEPVERGAAFTDERFSSEEMVDTVLRTLEVLGLDWEVKSTTETNIFSIKAADETVKVPANREYTTNETLRLPLHEIGVHAVRAANGYEQEYEVLGSGAGGYHQAEEGVALLFEEATGLTDPGLRRKYAARAKSVQSAIDGDNFSDTFEMNLGFGMDEDLAWKTAMRAHRGGGFIKDHVYGEGYRQLMAYVADQGGEGMGELAEMEGSLEDLMVGKVSVGQAHELRNLDMDAEYSALDVVYNMDQIAPAEVDPAEHMEVDSRLDEWYSAAS